MEVTIMKSVNLTVEGMSCHHCVNAIETALKSIHVIGKADLTSKSVQVEYDESNVSLDLIKATIEDQGYTVK